jgi:AP-1-like factor
MSHAGGPPEEDAQAKALKRKNQNRAAQKAFRERREQRVKDVSRSPAD